MEFLQLIVTLFLKNFTSFHRFLKFACRHALLFIEVVYPYLCSTDVAIF